MPLPPSQPTSWGREVSECNINGHLISLPWPVVVQEWVPQVKPGPRALVWITCKRICWFWTWEDMSLEQLWPPCGAQGRSQLLEQSWAERWQSQILMACLSPWFWFFIMLAQPLVSVAGANLFLLKPVGLGFLTFAIDTSIAFGMKFRFLSEAHKALCYLASLSSQPHLSSPSALHLMFWQDGAFLNTL